MGLFSLTQELAIDLGTANTLIMHNGKVVVDEPSIVALNIKTGILASGAVAAFSGVGKYVKSAYTA